MSVIDFQHFANFISSDEGHLDPSDTFLPSSERSLFVGLSHFFSKS